MIPKIKELIERPSSFTITMEYTSGYTTCTVKRPYVKHLAVQSVGGTDEDALEEALKLLDKVKALEEKIDIIKEPPIEKQRFVKGYCREFLYEDYEVEFKRTHSGYDVTGITRKDKNGYYYIEEPYEVTDKIWEASEEEYDRIHGDGACLAQKKLLGPDEKLYRWDNIGPLCGSAGLLVVKDGKVIKSKMTMIS